MIKYVWSNTCGRMRVTEDERPHTTATNWELRNAPHEQFISKRKILKILSETFRYPHIPRPKKESSLCYSTVCWECRDSTLVKNGVLNKFKITNLIKPRTTYEFLLVFDTITIYLDTLFFTLQNCFARVDVKILLFNAFKFDSQQYK